VPSKGFAAIGDRRGIASVLRLTGDIGLIVSERSPVAGSCSRRPTTTPAHALAGG
jgi:hypothetical protein